MSAFDGLRIGAGVRATLPRHRVANEGTAADLGYTARVAAGIRYLSWWVVACQCGAGFCRVNRYEALSAFYDHILEKEERDI